MQNGRASSSTRVFWQLASFEIRSSILWWRDNVVRASLYSDPILLLWLLRDLAFSKYLEIFACNRQFIAYVVQYFDGWKRSQNTSRRSKRVNWTPGPIHFRKNIGSRSFLEGEGQKGLLHKVGSLYPTPYILTTTTTTTTEFEKLDLGKYHFNFNLFQQFFCCFGSSLDHGLPTLFSLAGPVKAWAKIKPKNGLRGSWRRRRCVDIWVTGGLETPPEHLDVDSV